MKLTLINYGAGNIKSIQFAFQRLGVEAKLSNNTEEILNSEKVIFPGVGEASSAMEKLKQSGLDILIPQLTQPVLGICLGMQLMCNTTEEGNTKGLGIFDVVVKRFSSKKNELRKGDLLDKDNRNLGQGSNDVNLDYRVKVPQMGWNTITHLKSDLFKGIDDNAYMYLVHSYYAESCKEMIATTSYGFNYASALQKDNFYGVQFHPEKSGKVGEQILKNFLSL